MKKIRFALVVAVFMSSFSNLASQTTQNSSNGETASECLWVGTVETTFNFDKRHETIFGTLMFEWDEQSSVQGIVDAYKLSGGNLTWKASGTWNDCTIQGYYTCDVMSLSPIYSLPVVVGGLEVYNDGRYFYQFYFLDQSEIYYKVTCSDRTETSQGLFGNLMKQDTVLYYVQNDQLVGELTLHGIFSLDDVYTERWNFHKESSGETMMIIESADYESWLPEAAINEIEGNGEDVGNVLTFKASLIEADGTTACATADNFTFELIKSSHEPGVCLNYPRTEDAGKDYDLHFKQELNSPDDVMSPDRLKLTTEGGREATATVASFDWGAYGTLEVTAHMQGGKEIKGYLKGYPESTDILIPKRSGDSKIADKWKLDHGVAGLPDDDDSENEPVGDKNPGDGFTLYEEYRGFYVKGGQTEGDPKTKDLFVFSESDDFLPGIQLFKALTGLNVHDQLYGSEFNKEIRVMNFNYLEAPHSVDQHGLWIKKDDSKGYSYTMLGPPKNSGPVNICSGAYGFRTIRRGTSKEITNELNVTVAHELGHAVRINHHGEADKTLTYSSQLAFNPITETFDIKFSETGHAGFVIPKWENERLFTQRLIGKKYIAVWGGEHCGFEDCIMRYDVAFAYIPGPGTGGDIRYIVRDGERTGIMLCDKKEDSPGGVNYLSRQPRSRYGSAVKGDCIHQICVNDKYH